MAIINKRIINRLKERDEEAFDIVYDTYYKLVYYIAYDILNDKDGAEDVLQDTFIKLMDNIDSYEDKGNFKQYLTTIAKNIALNEYKRRKNQNVVELTDDMSQSDDHSSFEAILTIENTLDKEESKIVEYKILLDYSFQEIADELGLTLGKVQSTYYNAIKKLKNYFL